MGKGGRNVDCETSLDTSSCVSNISRTFNFLNQRLHGVRLVVDVPAMSTDDTENDVACWNLNFFWKQNLSSSLQQSVLATFMLRAYKQASQKRWSGNWKIKVQTIGLIADTDLTCKQSVKSIEKQEDCRLVCWKCTDSCLCGASVCKSLVILCCTDWTWIPSNESHEIMHRQIIRYFGDAPHQHSPFSIHQLVEIGTKHHGKKPGDWFGPSSIAHTLR